MDSPRCACARRRACNRSPRLRCGPWGRRRGVQGRPPSVSRVRLPALSRASVSRRESGHAICDKSAGAVWICHIRRAIAASRDEPGGAGRICRILQSARETPDPRRAPVQSVENSDVRSGFSTNRGVCGTNVENPDRRDGSSTKCTVRGCGSSAGRARVGRGSGAGRARSGGRPRTWAVPWFPGERPGDPRGPRSQGGKTPRARGPMPSQGERPGDPRGPRSQGARPQDRKP